ncbi:MAG TPA: hypothetical protein VKX34_04300 [Aequorivita sp.]|nr:hypothetical protein [Aequorivita sp.]
MSWKTTLFFLLSLGLSMQFYGQQKKAVKDSTQLYEKIEDYSEKNKVTKMIHRWIFRPSGTKPKHNEDKDSHTNYEEYSGKIIRNIIIDTKDPFGYSVTDSTETPTRWHERAGNTLHIKSKEMAIRKFLLLKEDEPLDPLLITESARLLRAQDYIREVNITPTQVQNSKDSIDIVITSLDSWSLIPRASFSANQTRLSVRERNFIGMGHRAKVGYSKRLKDGNTGFEAIYSVPNIRNTFIDATGHYNIDYEGYYHKSISVDRAFYSPLARWAGGISLEENYLSRPLPNDTLAFIGQDLKFISQDYWAGYSFRIFSGSSERERTTNLIASGRVLLVDYFQTPSIEYDTIHYFSGETFFLGSIGVASRQFIEDRYIFRDGIVEDVPVGIVYSATAGLQRKNNISRPYVGAKVSYGNYFKWGFLSANIEAGTFFNNSKSEQTAYRFQANYFSNLLSLGDKWKMRQFVKPEITIGANRFDSPIDRLSLNQDPYFNGAGKNSNIRNGNIQGFDSYMYGTRKYVLSLQTQFYSPWVWWGFRVNPYINMTFGMLTDEQKIFENNKLYSSFGVGCIIRNDYFVFNSFQLSLAFYPRMPGQGSGILKANAFDNDDFGFQNFQIGKPRIVIYE